MCGLAAHDKPRVTRLAQGFQDNLTGLNSSQTLLMLVRGGGGRRGGGGGRGGGGRERGRGTDVVGF